MAKIIGLKEQKIALNQINATLKEIEPINNFLSASNPSGVYTISFEDSSGKTYKTKMLTPDKSNIDALVRAHKSNLSKNLLEKASAFNIALDDEEMALIESETASTPNDHDNPSTSEADTTSSQYDDMSQ